MNNNRLIRILLLLGLVTGIALAVIYRDRFDAAALEAWIREAGAIAPLLFVLVYALATVLFLPGSVHARRAARRASEASHPDNSTHWTPASAGVTACSELP